MRLPTIPWHRGLDSLRLYRYGVTLLLERRLWFFLIIDLGLVLSRWLEILVEGAFPAQIYVRMVLVPTLLLQLPALCTLVHLERRAGCLDVALAVPSPERYFLLRLAPVSLFFVLQAWIVLAFLGDMDLASRLAAMAASAEVVVLLSAIALFWAVRLRSAGGVLVASLLSAALLWKWIVFLPFAPRTSSFAAEKLYGHPVFPFALGWNCLVLALAATLFYLYARLRLRRPETILQ